MESDFWDPAQTACWRDPPLSKLGTAFTLIGTCVLACFLASGASASVERAGSDVGAHSASDTLDVRTSPWGKTVLTYRDFTPYTEEIEAAAEAWSDVGTKTTP